MIIRSLLTILIFWYFKCESMKTTLRILQLQVWHCLVFIRRLHRHWNLDWSMDYKLLHRHWNLDWPMDCKLLKTEVISNLSSSFNFNSLNKDKFYSIDIIKSKILRLGCKMAGDWCNTPSECCSRKCENFREYGRMCRWS